MAKTMNALALNDKGTAMKTVEITRRTPTANQLLVQVQYSAIDTALDAIAERSILAGYMHDMKTTPLVTGYHYAGKVVAVGSEVTSFKVGDAVFGHLQYEPKQTQGAFSEYVTVFDTDVALVPFKVPLRVAAASATETMTALQAMRDVGGLKSGQSILIIGAGGGVGSAAVGIAKALGAKNVVAVCGTKDVSRVKQMGADRVLDRSNEDVTKLKEKFHVVFDVPNKFGFRKARKLLDKGGAYVNTLPTMETLALGWFWPLVTHKSMVTVECWSQKEYLELVGSWMADGKLVIDIDSIHKVLHFAKAWKRQNDSKKKGRIVIQVQDGW